MKYQEYLILREIRIDCDDNKKFDIISKITERQKRSKKKIINIDGVRVSERWLVVVKSIKHDNLLLF